MGNHVRNHGGTDMEKPVLIFGEIKKGEKEICSWLNVTPEILRTLREEGMPHFHVGRQIWVHTGAVNDWFYKKGMKDHAL